MEPPGPVGMPGRRIQYQCPPMDSHRVVTGRRARGIGPWRPHSSTSGIDCPPLTAGVFAIGDVTGIFPHTHAANAIGCAAAGSASFARRVLGPLACFGPEAVDVEDVDSGVVDGDEVVPFEFLENLVQRRPLYTQHGGKCPLRELD